MKKICIPVTSRGNYGKFKSLMEEISHHPDLELQLIVAGGALLHNYGNFIKNGKLSGFKVDKKLYFLLEGENPTTMAKSTGIGLMEFTTAFNDLQPDVVMSIADRFEEMAIATAAAYTNIPLAHLEGGEVSGSIDDSIRHSITKLSHLHFPATKEAAHRIEKLGEPQDTIYPVGSTSFDIIRRLDLEDVSEIEERQLNEGVGPALDLSEDYLIIIQHPVTTEYGSNIDYINETIAAIDELEIPTIWLWPNMDAGSDSVSKGIRVYREQEKPDFIHFYTSLPLEDFAPLLNNSVCIVGNSSTGIREASFLGIPTVNIGNRQSGRARGENVIDVPHEKEKIKSAIQKQRSHGPYEQINLYGDGHAAEKIVDVIADFDFEIQKRIAY